MKKQILRQMQKKMHNQLTQMQDELGGKNVEGTSGGGAVKVVMSGKQEIISVNINPEVVNPQEVDVLEDLVFVAVKDALEKSQKLGMEMISQITGGVKLPGM